MARWVDRRWISELVTRPKHIQAGGGEIDRNSTHGLMQREGTKEAIGWQGG